jgi:antitoxin component HigA of HigAB toxin-antitoxin module
VVHWGFDVAENDFQIVSKEAPVVGCRIRREYSVSPPPRPSCVDLTLPTDLRRSVEFRYPDAATALDAWLEVAGTAHWESYNEVLETYASADQVGSCLGFNLTAYDALLLKYKPRPIRNDREHRRALQHVEELIGQHGPTPPQAEGESKEVTKAEVARATGIPRSTITNVVSGRRQISKENVTRLAKYFHVDPSVLLPER